MSFFCLNYGFTRLVSCMSVCVCLRVGTAPFSVVKARLSADIHGGYHGGPGLRQWLISVFHLQVFCFNSDRLCLAFTSQRSTGVTTAAASARPSPPVHASQTAVDMKKHSDSALGKISHSFISSVCLASAWVGGCVRENRFQSLQKLP